MESTEKSLAEDWHELLFTLQETLGKRPTDLNAVLFLMGVQELGRGPQLFTKEQKQDLMHIAVCKALSFSGFYELEGRDADGWPHWRLVKPLPHFDIFSQEALLKIHIIRYFREELQLI
ncbi:MAG: hypothetical protein EAZ70_07810 [Runella slithyformis]|nr:MAG: hypothetical protein EAY79_07240 [Runella slithyformis]TAF93340.1 MAG: hypothetical protein EAZ46_12420 [Runella sp.]TAG24049.1 MAG: hypothetical protein EAZ38_01935 [Cytophagales bacterium]TAG34822.1 MAG: hypothetical protein EAZ32_19220 [Cytophagia bacterium]TAE92167.1 MAG: hypothetical protein EAZ80_12225 [Runella slithyformis]